MVEDHAAQTHKDGEKSAYYPGKVIKKYRKLKRWSQQRLAEHWPKKDGEIGVDFHYIQLVERGKRNIVDQPVLRKVSVLLDIPLREFGYCEYDPYVGGEDLSVSGIEDQKVEQSDQALVAELSMPSVTFQDTSRLDAAPSDSHIESTIESDLEIEREEDLNEKRRQMVQRGIELVTAATVVPVISSSIVSNSTSFLCFPFSSASLHNLAIIAQQFREMHRRGETGFWAGLHTHIMTIQDGLTRTTDDVLRRELWRLFAQAQLLARLGCQPSPTKRQELAQGKTYNELAIAYAQNSGDTVLKGGTIGHLAQFYLRQEPDLAKATQYVNEAQQFAEGNNALTGWLSLLQASIEAKTGHARQCERSLVYAIDRARDLPRSPEYSDIYYTDFNLISAQVFCINCWLTIGNAKKAQACFTEANLADLSENRQASAFYDVSRLYAALGDFDLTQTYAFQAIDKAIETQQLYVISRCRALAITILKREKREPHATAIAEYAQIILETYKRSTR